MSKQVTPLNVEDVSSFSRALVKQIEQNNAPLTHVRMLNMLAKSNGYQNFQHMKVAEQSRPKSIQWPKAGDVDQALISRCLNQFDARGRLVRWPARNKVQQVCIWVLWSKIPAGSALTEGEINDVLNAQHLFEDPATLRRVMIGYKMLQRRRDGSEYLRIEQKLPAEALALIGEIKSRIEQNQQ